MIIKYMQNSIKLWIEQIQQKPIASLSLIKDTQYLQSILHKLDPAFFKSDPNPSYDSLVQSITQYYNKILFLDVTHSILMAKKDQDSIQMWVIVLGIAIRCSERNLYIQLILKMDEKTQSSLMGFISRIDDTLGACPSLDLESSSKKENIYIQKHLLNTIDQLSEENALIKGRVEDLEDEINTLKTNKQLIVDSLQKQIDQINLEREEILNDYQGVYKTDNLSIIIKAIVSENNLLKEIIEKREGLTESIEREKEDILKEMEKVVLKNQILNINVLELSALQTRIEQQQEEIASLRKNENQLLNKVFTLQRGSSINHFERPRPQTIQPGMHPRYDKEVPEQVEIEAQPKIKSKNKFTERLLKSIKQKGHALLDDLSLDERQKEYIATIEQQQARIAELSKEVERVVDEYQVKETEVKYSNEKNKEIKEKLKHLEEIKEVYQNNARTKDLIFAETNEEYAQRFGELMAEIESLHSTEQKLGEQIKENAQNSVKTNSQYESKLARVMSMMEAELITFRNKELEYLEVIRELKESRGNQLFNSALDVNRSAFKMQRSSVFESGELEKKPSLGSVQQSQEYDIKQTPENEEDASEESPLIQTLKSEIANLQKQIKKAGIENGEMSNELIRISNEYKEELQRSTGLRQEITKQKLLVKEMSEKVTQFLEKWRDRLKGQGCSGAEQFKEECKEQYIVKMQEFIQQIKAFQRQRVDDVQNILEYQSKLKQYLTAELELILQAPQQSKQSPGTNHTSQPLKQPKEKYDLYNNLSKQHEALKLQLKQLSTTIINLKSENMKLHKESLSHEEQKSHLKQKIIQLEYQMNTTNSDSLKSYGQMSQLLDSILREKLNRVEHQSLNQDHSVLLQGEQESPLKAGKEKLMRELDKQSMCLQLFKRQYQQLFTKYQHIQEQHQLLLAVFADLAIDLHP